MSDPGGALTCEHDMGMSDGQDPLFQALWPLTRPPVSLCSSSEDPSFLKLSVIFNKKIGKFFDFCRSKSPFSPEFQLYTSKISLKLPLFRPYFCPTRFKVECPPPARMSDPLNSNAMAALLDCMMKKK